MERVTASGIGLGSHDHSFLRIPRTQIIGLQDPNTIYMMYLGPETLLFGSLDPLGIRDAVSQKMWF